MYKCRKNIERFILQTLIPQAKQKKIPKNSIKMSTSTPLFSILIANYNNEKYLEECLNSVFHQTYTNWEIIIVDDASTDNSKSIYKKYKKDNRVKIFYNKKNKGCGYTKNKCVQLATGSICGFLDPDDLLTDSALSIMVQKHIENPIISLIYSTHYVCNEYLKDKKIATYCAPINTENSYLETKIGTISHFATFKKNNYEKTSGINPKLPKAVDQDLYLKLEETGPTLFINKVLYFYRHHRNSISLNKNANLAMIYGKKCRLDAYKRRVKNKINIGNLSKENYIALRKEYLYLLIFEAIQYKKMGKLGSMYLLLLRAIPFIDIDKRFSIIRIALNPFKTIQ